MPWEKTDMGEQRVNICRAGGEREGAHERFVPGVWCFAPDGLSLAAAISAGWQRDSGHGTQPSARNTVRGQTASDKTEERVVALREEGVGSEEAGRSSCEKKVSRSR